MQISHLPSYQHCIVQTPYIIQHELGKQTLLTLHLDGKTNCYTDTVKVEGDEHNNNRRLAEVAMIALGELRSFSRLSARIP